MQEPNLQIYHQSTWQNRLLTWFAATRPAFFSASVLAVFTGLALVWHVSGTLKMDLAILTVFAIMLFQAGANVLNDYFDMQTDNANQERVYPFSGGSRFIQNAVLSQDETLWLGGFLLLTGVSIGLWMVWLTDVTLLWIGLVGGALAVFYSAPPCLTCRGLGDISIALAFGVLPVTGTVWIQLGEVPTAAWWLGTIVGIFTAAILWINSIPDITADRQAGKWTLPARLGKTYAPYGLVILFAMGFGLIILAPLPAAMHWAALALFPSVFAVVNALQNKLLSAIPQVLLTHAAVCIGLTIGGMF